jgi:S1-C subfamily serine protease
MFLSAVAALLLSAPAPLPRAVKQSTYLGIDAKPVEGGVLIDVIYISSPAEQAGLNSYAVITSIDGKPVRNLSDLAAVLRACKPNESVPVVVRREGDTQEETVQVKLALKKPYCYLGANLNQSRIVDMPENSPARRAGLKPNDVILTIDGRKVTTSREVVEALNMHRPGDTIPVVVNREGSEVKVSVKIGERPGY